VIPSFYIPPLKISGPMVIQPFGVLGGIAIVLGEALPAALASSDTSEATVPSEVTIPTGRESAEFDIRTVSDGENDGTRPAAIGTPSSGRTARCRI